MLTYYDHHRGVTRYKRRYVWALLAFILGIVVGLVLAHLF